MSKGPITFNAFIEDFTTNSVVENSKTAQYIYENIICREDIRIKMAELSDVGITALSACAVEIEETCALTSSDLSLDTKIIRQTIGRMVAASLEPLGYTPYKRGRVNAGKSSKFTSAKVYHYTGGEIQTIVKHIVDAEY